MQEALVRLDGRGLPRDLERESAGVLQACSNARNSAQDQVGVILLLTVGQFFLVHLLAQRAEGEHLGNG